MKFAVFFSRFLQDKLKYVYICYQNSNKYNNERENINNGYNNKFWF